MVNEILHEAEERMKQVVQATRREFLGIRTGRANPSLLERITVDYYNTPVPLNQLASITAPEPRLLVIQPYDKGALKEMEKAILKSDLGLTPTSDGQVLRVQLPPLTEERRRELVRVIRKEAEERRVAVRSVRREVMDRIKALEKEGSLSADESRREQEKVQKLTERYIGQIDELLEQKEKEVLEV